MRAFLRLEVALMFVVFMYLDLTAYAQEYGPKLQEYVNKTARFEALMPTGVAERTITGKTLVDTEYRSLANVDGGKFEVRVRVPIPFTLDDADLVKTLRDDYMDQAQNQFTASFGAAVRDIEISQHGSTGRDFAFEGPGKIVSRRRVLFDGQRLYQIIVEGTSALANSRSATLFLDSVGPMGSGSAKKTVATGMDAGRVGPDSLRKYISKQYGYEILLPPNVKGDKSGRQWAGTQELTYYITVKAYTDELRRRLDAMSRETIEKEIIRSVPTDFPVADPEIIDVPGTIGVQVVTKINEPPNEFRTHKRIRLLVGDNGYYALNAVGTLEKVQSAEAETVFRSFRVPSRGP